MKHLKQLAYKVIQFELPTVLLIGSMIGAIFFLVFGLWYPFPLALIFIFLTELYRAHKSFKQTGKY